MRNRFPSPARRTTIQDVADAAGVSKGTVSKYLNSGHGYYMSAATKSKIESAIAKLDFTPSAVAQSLSQSRTHTIGVVVPDIQNSFYPDLIAGIDSVTASTGYTLELGTTAANPDQETDIIEAMMRRRVDGLVLAATRINDDLVQRILSAGVPVCLASRKVLGVDCDSVVIDGYAGAKTATFHLASLGHTRIAHIAGPQNVQAFAQRASGYLDSLRECRIEPDDRYLIEAEIPTPEEGARAVHQLLDMGTARPTAVFVGNDAMALGVMDVIRQRGLSIPQDISVVGFDNIPISRNSFISLTTIDSKAQTLGADAVKILLSRLQGPTPFSGPPINKVHSAELMIRGTTGPTPR